MQNWYHWAFQKLFDERTGLFRALRGALKNTSRSEGATFIFKQLLGAEISLTQCLASKSTRQPALFQKSFDIWTFLKMCPWLWPTGSSEHFVTAAASLSSNPRHLVEKKWAKNICPPSWHTSIGLLPAELPEQWVRKGQKTLPAALGTNLASIMKCRGGNTPTGQQYTSFAQQGATQRPFHPQFSPSPAPRSMATMPVLSLKQVWEY